ncbi:hypothetical protein HDV00_003614 [Rhizophlyctis rosea]|nr:hypothetical protein HDV00_003614 [Rhizophlyctis rosea]
MSLRRSSRRSSQLATESLATGIRRTPRGSRNSSVNEDIDTTPARAYRDAAAHSATEDDDVIVYSGTPVRGRGRSRARGNGSARGRAAGRGRGGRRAAVERSDESEGEATDERGGGSEDQEQEEQDESDKESVVETFKKGLRRISRELTPTPVSIPKKRGGRRVTKVVEEKEEEEEERVTVDAELDEDLEPRRRSDDELEDTTGPTTVPWRWEYAGEIYDQMRNITSCFWPLAFFVGALLVLAILAIKDKDLFTTWLTPESASFNASRRLVKRHFSSNNQQPLLPQSKGQPAAYRPSDIWSTTPHTGTYRIVALSPLSPTQLVLTPSNILLLLARAYGLPKIITPAEEKIPVSAAYQLEKLGQEDAYRILSVSSEVWCSGGGVLPDGRIVSVGGWEVKDGEEVLGGGVRMFDGGEWKEDAKHVFLQQPRWESTVIRLSTGDLAIIGGTQKRNPQPYIEFLPPSPDCPFGADCLIPNKLLKEVDMEGVRFPFAHVLASGRIFLLGGKQSTILDPSNRFLPVKEGQHIPPIGISDEEWDGPSRTYPSGGTSVLLPLSSKNGWKAEILVCGGGARSPAMPKVLSTALTSCGRISPELDNPEWEYDEMPNPRTMGTPILLPDRKLLLVNGAQKGTAGYNAATKAAYEAVLYDMDAPLGMRWRVLNGTDVARMYHSTALLLPSAEVLLAGSSPNKNPMHPAYPYPSNEARLELFTPAYLQTGRPRPTIITASLRTGPIPYGDMLKFTATLPNRPSGNAKRQLGVVLVDNGYSTHGQVMGQRVISLDVVAAEKLGEVWRVEVETPPSGGVAPVGWYLMFVVDGGVPSEGVWVKVGEWGGAGWAA